MRGNFKFATRLSFKNRVKIHENVYYDYFLEGRGRFFLIIKEEDMRKVRCMDDIKKFITKSATDISFASQISKWELTYLQQEDIRKLNFYINNYY